MADATQPKTDRQNHLEWCKQRALEYVDQGDVNQAWASFLSDMGKEESTRDHEGLQLGNMLFVGGHLRTPQAMREHIEGFN